MSECQIAGDMLEGNIIGYCKSVEGGRCPKALVLTVVTRSVYKNNGYLKHCRVVIEYECVGIIKGANGAAAVLVDPPRDDWEEELKFPPAIDDIDDQVDDDIEEEEEEEEGCPD